MKITHLLHCLLIAIPALLLPGVQSLVHAQLRNRAQSASTTLQDMEMITQRRLSTIVGATTGASSISSWLSTLQPNGSWPASEVDYTTGCNAQTGSWPAQVHWERISTFAAAWHGGLKNAGQWVNHTQLRGAISSAMGFWFENDFTDPSCLDSGGTSTCPCGTPGFWNTNWFSNIILIPTFIGKDCLLLNNSLTPTELGNCTHITGRAYATFGTQINGLGSITGANTLDIASIGIDLGLLTVNESLLEDAFGRIHSEVVIENGVKADGIRADGSFGQHAGLLYNGNYGKDYANDVFDVEIEAGGTSLAAGSASRSAFNVLWQANPWMIFRNTVTNVLHWDFSVLGRFIALPVADDQATENLKTNLTQLQVLGQEWNSATLTNAFSLLSLNTSDANSGALDGNMMFYTNDYMVQRGTGYVTSLKMFSTRTQNSECVTAQNPFGFHLSDGTLYTYLVGNEYEDISAAWDWNLIPGTTVDYNANALSCSSTGHTGTQPFVGGASDGSIGVAAMRYETPVSKTLNWRKTWFFLENDVQHVMVARITSATSAPVFSVLDQRLHVGEILVDGVAQTGGNFSAVSSLWHGGVGYTFNKSNTAVSLSVQSGERTGPWSAIGTSKQPPATVDLFSAWLNHANLAASVDYTIYPATTAASFQTKYAEARVQTVRNDGSISALLDIANKVAMFVFWETAGGTSSIPSIAGSAPITIASTGSAAVIVRTDSWNVTVAEPTQTLSTLSLTFTLGAGSTPAGWGSGSSKALVFTLPTGGLAGGSLSQSLF
ncbi:polysaccharide lyase family 8 protein [Artomyces pyxidatus]|uniref:Polysaccharide lyase family 8 protein n=1 Tax=Artomyces pyxidatus TaxID=48021 RepID=A0ACB8TGV8_9AGAM|nr:polysaccharide lyase family 8 protein [Artomyces pyxidatus]